MVPPAVTPAPPGLAVSGAAPADIPQLCGLLAELFAQESDFRPDAENQAAGLRLILENPELGRVLVAREAGRVVGMVNLLFFISPRRGGLTVMIEDVIVQKPRRSGGVGSLLLTEAVALSRSLGAAGAGLLTDRDNAPAIRLYRRHGFRETRAHVMRMALKSRPDDSPAA